MKHLKSVFVFIMVAGFLAGCASNNDGKQAQLAAYSKCIVQQNWQQLYNMDYRPPNNPLPVISCKKYRKGLTNIEISHYQMQQMEHSKSSGSGSIPHTAQGMYQKAYGK